MSYIEQAIEQAIIHLHQVYDNRLVPKDEPIPWNESLEIVDKQPSAAI